MKEALSLVERGWHDARRCSLDLDGTGIGVTHLIKGHLSSPVHRMIQPYPHIRLWSVPRSVFRVALWVVLIGKTMTRQLGWVLVDHQRTLTEVTWWCRTFGVTPVLMQGDEHAYALEVAGTTRHPSEVFGVRTASCV